ncbi:MAG: T9SS C-terminal target domain-containing protein, partial [Candidatus Latescibacterota bacterium]
DRAWFVDGLDCFVGNYPNIATFDIDRGDSVLISGLAGPYFGNLQMGSIVDNIAVVTKGLPVPAPATVSLATALTEPYEGKLVRIEGLKVLSDSIGYGEFSLWKGTGLDTISVDDIFDPGSEPFHPNSNGAYDPQTGDSVLYVQGCLNYDFSHRKINPRDRDDICSTRLTDVQGGVPGYVNALLANRPNPFNPTTTIEFTLSAGAKVDLTVYDTAGRAVRTLKDGVLPAGAHSVTWDGTNASGKEVSSGVYFYRLHTPGFEDTQKMVLLR